MVRGPLRLLHIAPPAAAAASSHRAASRFSLLPLAQAGGGGGDPGLNDSLLETPTMYLSLVFFCFIALSFTFEIVRRAVAGPNACCSRLDGSLTHSERAAAASPVQCVHALRKVFLKRGHPGLGERRLLLGCVSLLACMRPAPTPVLADVLTRCAPAAAPHRQINETIQPRP